MKVDLYYDQLKFQKLTQKAAYTIESFFGTLLRHISLVQLYCLGEFGGYLGLLIGASAISLLELLDLLIYGSILWVLFFSEYSNSKT